MKQKLLTMLIVGALIIVGLGACNKDSSSIFPFTPSPSPQPHVEMNLVAHNWVNTGNGTYVNVFDNVLSSLPVTGGGSLKVYVQEGGQKTLINRSASMFHGNHLWYSTTRTDLILNASSGKDGIPFGTLHIVLVVN